MIFSNTLILMVLTVLAGFTVPVQTGLNAQLGKVMGNPVLASLLSFLVGFVSLLIFVAVTQIQWPPLEKLSAGPWWAWLGGVCGAIFVTTMIIMAPRLGATTTIALIIGGQMLASLVLDHYGLLGFPQHPANFFRVIGAALLIAGVFLIQRF